MSLSNRDCLEQAVSSPDLGRNEIGIDELARLARSGDAEAFAVLATRFRPRLLVALSKRLDGRTADAEDVTQDTLAKAWSSIRSYDCNRSFSAWIYTIAFRRATDYLRRQKRRLHSTQPLPAHDIACVSVRQPTTDRESSDNIWSIAKRELTNPQYVALWLRYAEDLSVSEIADTIGKTCVATRVLLHRARAKLQPHLVSENKIHEA